MGQAERREFQTHLEGEREGEVEQRVGVREAGGKLRRREESGGRDGDDDDERTDARRKRVGRRGRPDERGEVRDSARVGDGEPHRLQSGRDDETGHRDCGERARVEGRRDEAGKHDACGYLRGGECYRRRTRLQSGAERGRVVAIVVIVADYADVPVH